ncbi:MAG TPA: YihY family inner membrane protein [Deltaproteobacteria bacterium]|nr:YihY family inner membrane protein [Deltaproteobacteria bacterium]
MESITSGIEQIKAFLQTGIWRVRVKHLTGTRSFFIRYLRMALITAKEFVDDRCSLRASALTLYSLLAIVPVFALVFAIAKGFGFQKLLEQRIVEQFAGQEQVIVWVIEFARNLLENTRGGVLAGVGIALLLYAVFKVLDHIEASFNDIWAISKGRTLGKKLTDYLSLMLIGPILLILSSSATVLVMTHLTELFERFAILGLFSVVLSLVLNLIPYCLIWTLLAFVYMFMPNTKVKFSSSLLAGVVSGTVFVIVQWLYIAFQVGVTRYNAIYGSFAALPLFIVWLHLSWTIVLFGAELSFAHQNDDAYEYEPDSRKISPAFRKLLSLLIMHHLVMIFIRGEKAPHSQEISEILGIPLRLVREIISELVQSGLVSQTVSEADAQNAYQVGRDVNTLSVASVLEALERKGVDSIPLPKTDERAALDETLRNFQDQLERSGTNVLLKDLVAGTR